MVRANKIKFYERDFLMAQWVKGLYQWAEDLFYDVFYDKKDGGANPMTFSLGRTSFVVWMFSTVQLTYAGVALSYLWFLLGLSLLGYVIGKSYIITSLGGVTLNQTQNLDELNDH